MGLVAEPDGQVKEEQAVAVPEGSKKPKEEDGIGV